MFPGNSLAAVFSNHKLVCFDVGALNGFRGLELLHPFTELYGFEPEETACAQLNQSVYTAAGLYKAKAWPIALSDKNGEEPFYIAGNGAMNSLLKPVPEQFDVYFGEAAGSKYWREQLELIDCTFTPEQVFDVGEKAVKHETELYEKTRFFPIGDAVYIKHPGALTTDQALRAACVLLYWGYTGVARKLLARNPDHEESQQLLKQFLNLQQQPPKKSALKGWIPPVLWNFLKKLRRS